MKIGTWIDHYSLSCLIVTYDPTKQQIHILICQTKQKSISTKPYAHWNIDFKIHKAYILIRSRSQSTRSASKININTMHRGRICQFFLQWIHCNSHCGERTGQKTGKYYLCEGFKSITYVPFQYLTWARLNMD